MSFVLRSYQQEAVNKMVVDLSNKNKSILSLPTGSGKSIIIAEFANYLDKPIIILQPSREILSQNREKLLNYVDKSNVGVFSASFKSKQIKKYTFATIQSVYKKPELFTDFSTIIIDEAHLYKQKGMFDQFIRSFRDLKLFGLTATPFRLEQKQKYIHPRQIEVYSVLRMLTQEGFDDIIYTISQKELTDQGYLAPIDYITEVEIPANFSLNSDKKIVESFQLQLAFGGMKKIESVLSKIKNYKSIIVFCPSVKTARLMNSITTNASSAFVSGDTPAKERHQIIEDFKDGTRQIVYNVGVLTTGFDHPQLDCIMLMRPTKSLILYNQMIGRGVRTAPGKTKCTVFDTTGTVKHLGKLEDIEIKKIDDKWDVISAKGKNRNKIMSYYKKKI